MSESVGSNSKKAVKAGIAYTIGNILVKGINFLALPLFSRIMTPDEFGVYNVCVSYDAILFVVIGLAMHSSIRSANYEFRGEIDRYTSSISLIYIAITAFFFLLFTLFGGILSKWMHFQRVILYMLIIYSFGSAVLNLYNQRLSLNYSYKKYILVSLTNSLGNIGLSLVLILTVFRDHRDIGRIIGSSTAIFILACALLVSFYRKAKPRFNRAYWQFGIKYSLPIVPHGISQVLLAQFDRIMIHSMVSASAAGIYSLAGNINLIMTIITDSISTAWSTWFYEEIDKKHYSEIQKRAAQLSALFMIFTIGAMAVSPELILLLGGKAYENGKYVAIPMIMDAFVLFLYNVIVPSEYYTKKTTYIMFGTMVAAVINLITNYIFIKRYGYIAAAYTTLFSYVCFVVLHIIISRKLVGFYVIPMKWIALLCGSAAAMAVVFIVFIESLAIRWGACAVVVIPMMIAGYGILKKDMPIKRRAE